MYAFDNPGEAVNVLFPETIFIEMINDRMKDSNGLV